MEKGIYKIGRTTQAPQERAAELSAATGIPVQFLVVASWECPDCVTAERLVHESLAPYRLSSRREFFQAPYEVIHRAVQQALRLAESATG